jgi:hypothetical protein
MTKRFLNVHAICHFSTLLFAAVDPDPRQGLGAASDYSTLLSLTLRLAERNGEDASHRLLQPTYDTSTRKSFDS